MMGVDEDSSPYGGYDPDTTYKPDLEGYEWMPQKRLAGTTDADWVFVQATGKPFTVDLAGRLAKLFNEWGITDPRQYIYLQKGRTYTKQGQQAELRQGASERLHPDKTDVWRKDPDGNLYFQEATHYIPVKAWGMHIRRHPDFTAAHWDAIRRATVDADALNPHIWLAENRIARREIKRSGTVVREAYNPENIDAKTIPPPRHQQRFRKSEIKDALRRLQAERIRHLPPDQKEALATELQLTPEEFIDPSSASHRDVAGAPRDLAAIEEEIELLTAQLREQDLRHIAEQDLIGDAPAHYNVVEVEGKPKSELTAEEQARVAAADPKDWFKEPTAQLQHRDILGGVQKREPIPSIFGELGRPTRASAEAWDERFGATSERTRAEIAAEQLPRLTGSEDDFLKLDDLLAREQDPDVKALLEARQGELIDAYLKPTKKLGDEIRGSIQEVADPEQFKDELASYENRLADLQDLPDLTGLEKDLLGRLAERAKRMNGRGQSAEAKAVRAQRKKLKRDAEEQGPLFNPNKLGALGGNIDWSIVKKLFERYRGGIGKAGRAIFGPAFHDQATQVKGLTAEMGYGKLLEVAEVQNTSLLADVEGRAHKGPADAIGAGIWKKLVDEDASLQKAVYHAIQQGMVVDTVDNPAQVARLVKGGKAEAQSDEAIRNMLMSQQHIAQAGLNVPYQQFMILSTNLRAVVTVRQHRATARAEHKRLTEALHTAVLSGAGKNELRKFSRKISKAKKRLNKAEAEWKRVESGAALMGDFTPERTQAALHELQRTQTPEAWRRIVTAADTHAKAHDQGLTQANELGMISDELVQMYRARGDYHTPFMRIGNKTQAIYRLRQKMFRQQCLIGTRVSQLMDNYYAA